MDPCCLEARELVQLLAQCKLSARELMAAHLARIHAVNPRLNAIVGKLPDEECLTLAARVDELPRSEERRVGKECVRLCRSRWSPYH